MAGRKSWFKMPPKRQGSDANVQVIKQGCLTKSPPTTFHYIFSNRASWKGRLVKLCKTAAESYILRYYAYDGVSEDCKGEISVSDITAIELGTNTTDRIMTIIRLFNNSPENVLCLKTDKRDYYLVDDNVNNIEDWQKIITDVWVKINQTVIVDGPRIAHAVRLQAVIDQAEGARPKSYPEDRPCIDPALAEAQERQRSLTDPDNRKRIQSNFADYRALYFQNSAVPPESFTVSKDRKKSLTQSDVLPDWTPIVEELRRLSVTSSDQQNAVSCRLSDDTLDGAYDSENESIYDTPRSVAVNKLELPNSTEQEETSDLDTSDDGDNVYMTMYEIDNEESIDHPPKPLRNFKITKQNRYPKTQGSQLKKTYILKMMYEQQSQSDLVKTNIIVPTEHLKQYLGLQEVGDRLCVSKWKGPVEIGCLFHHGDHIDAINDFRPETKDLFLQMLSKSISDEVNLVVIRNKTADVFHVEGCSCDNS